MSDIKLGLVAAMPFPPQKASGIRVNNEIEAIKNKVEIRLYCCPPGLAYEKIDNVEIIRSSGDLDNENYFKYYSWRRKLAIDFQLAKLVATDIKKGKINIIHVHTVEGIFISIIIKLLVRKKIPVVADIHGPFIPELVHYKMIPNFFLFKGLFSCLETMLYNSVGILMGTSEGLVRYLKGKTRNKDKVKILSDYVFLEKFKKDIKQLSADEQGEVVNDQRPIIMYAGTLKDYQGLDYLFKAISIITKKTKSFKLVIVGDKGLGIDYYKKLSKELEIEDFVSFVGMVAHDKVPSYLQMADVLVSPRVDNDVTRGGFVSQMPEYLAMEKLIVSTNVSDCNLMLGSGAGILVKPNSAEELAKGLLEALYILQKDDLKEQYICNTIESAIKFSWEENGERLIKFYEQLIS